MFNNGLIDKNAFNETDKVNDIYFLCTLKSFYLIKTEPIKKRVLYLFKLNNTKW